MSKVCKYGCGVELGQFSTKENKFLEADNSTIHTKERCQELKQKSVPNNGNDISLNLVLAKLRKIGIDINLDLLGRVAVNGDKK
jgi:hypothetical protein